MSSVGQTKDAWGGATESYTRITQGFTTQAAYESIKLAEKRLPFDASSTRVIDQGCGTGAVPMELNKRYPGVPILATDISPGMLKVVDKKNFPNTTTRVTDSSDLAALRAENPNGFSHSLSNFMIQFIPDPYYTLSNMIDLTRPGGVVEIGSWGEVGVATILTDVVHEIDPTWETPSLWTSKDWPENTKQLKTLFEKNGLKDVHSEHHSLRFDFKSMEECIWFILDGQNPSMMNLTDDIRQRYGEEGVDKMKAIFASVMKKVGRDYKHLYIEAYITIGTKP